MLDSMDEGRPGGSRPTLEYLSWLDQETRETARQFDIVGFVFRAVNGATNEDLGRQKDERRRRRLRRGYEVFSL
jgi:hypothetical protein